MNTSVIILGIVIIVIGIYMYTFYSRIRNVKDVPKSEKIKELNEKNFQHQIKSGISLVDFWAGWCVPCKLMSPVLNELAETSPDVQVYKLNVEQYNSVASKYAVRNIPTMVLFKDGREINRFVGIKTKEYLLKQIQNTL